MGFSNVRFSPLISLTPLIQWPTCISLAAHSFQAIQTFNVSYLFDKNPFFRWSHRHQPLTTSSVGQWLHSSDTATPYFHDDELHSFTIPSKSVFSVHCPHPAPRRLIPLPCLSPDPMPGNKYFYVAGFEEVIVAEGSERQRRMMTKRGVHRHCHLVSPVSNVE
jgi:hypothetical protein